MAASLVNITLVDTRFPKLQETFFVISDDLAPQVPENPNLERDTPKQPNERLCDVRHSRNFTRF